MQEGGFGVFKFCGDVTRESEVRVLVDSTGDKARDVRCRAVYLRERIGEGRCSLDRGEVDFTDVVTCMEVRQFLRYYYLLNVRTSR